MGISGGPESPEGTQVTQSQSKTEPGAVTPMVTAEKPRDGEAAPPATQTRECGCMGSLEVRGSGD